MTRRRRRFFRRFGPEILVFVCAVVMDGMPTFLGRVLPPSTPDEFSYLLAADTFAHGRLTNPTHPVAEHFEGLHVLVEPTYASKYPPGLGLALATGRVLFGHAVVGAWGAAALGCAAICWFLRAWVGVRWAMIGGILAAAHPEVFFWSQTYWGGTVAMLGGALLLGAAARAVRRPHAWHGAVAAIGMAILANTRAYEGLLLTLIVMAWVIIASIRRRNIALLLKRLTVPASLILSATAAWMGYYNWRVTGDPLQMPYTLYARQYQIAPLFYWQEPRPVPDYRHHKIADYWTGYDLNEWQSQSTWGLFFRGAVNKLWDQARAFFNPPTLVLALAGLPLAVRYRRAARVAIVVLSLFLLAHIATTPWLRGHYLGPVVPLFIALLVISFMQIWRFRVGRLAIGAGVVAIVLIVQVVSVLKTIDGMLQNPRPSGIARATQIEELSRLPGDHLVLVRYGAGPQHLFEWVYNAADIDASKIIWAHDMGEQKNRRLFDYFPQRRVWMLWVEGNHYHREELTGRLTNPRELPQSN